MLKRAAGAIRGICAWPLAQGGEARLQMLLPGTAEEGWWQMTRKDHSEMVLRYSQDAHPDMVAWKHKSIN